MPLLTAHEQDGGKVMLVIDHRVGVDVDADHFERVARFVADVIGTCWGYGGHPRHAANDDPDFDRFTRFARVPHPSLAPHPVVEIAAVQTDDDVGEADRGT